MKFLNALVLTFACLYQQTNANETLKVIVGIEPHAYFVERIGGDHVDVHTLIGVNSDPHAFHLSGKEMVFLGKADVYFQAGLPFEEHLSGRLKGHFNGLFIDLRGGLELRHFACNHEHGHDLHHHHEAVDPHSWLDPINAGLQVATITNALCLLLPDKAQLFRNRAETLEDELSELDVWLLERFEEFKGRKLLVFHPALGYFCDQYGLEQIAVEQDGKQPGGKYLAELLSISKDEVFNCLIIEPQSNRKLTNVIVSELDLKPVIFNPLNKDYLSSLRNLADTLCERD